MLKPKKPTVGSSGKIIAPSNHHNFEQVDKVAKSKRKKVFLFVVDLFCQLI